MYACLYAHACVFVRMHTRLYVRARMRACMHDMHAFMSACIVCRPIKACMHACAILRMSVYTCMCEQHYDCVNLYLRLYINIYAHMYVHMHGYYACIRTYTYQRII